MSKRNYSRYNRYGKYYRRRNRYVRRFAKSSGVDALNRHKDNPGIVRVRGGNVLPAVLQTQFKYTTKLTFTITNGVATANNLYGNSLYDPLYVNGISMPQMFSELSTYYTRYNVTGSKITLELHNMSTTDPVDFYLVPVTDAGASYNFYVATNMPGAVKTTIPVTGADNCRTLTAYRKSASVWGISTFDNAMSAQYNANPNALWYWRMGASSAIVGSTNTSNIYATIYITFYTVLSQPRVVALGSNS